MHRQHGARLAAAAAFFALAFPPVAHADWVTFNSREGGFEASFPGTPRPLVDENKDDKGVVFATSHNFVAGNEAFRCIAGYTDYVPPVDAEAELAADRDNFAEAVGGKVTGSRRLTVQRPPRDQLPAMDLTAESPTEYFHAIFIIDGQRVFQAAAASSRNNPDGPAQTKTCLESFKLLPK